MGAPADETKAWRKIEANRRRGALEWVADPEMRVNRILLLPLAALFTRLQCHFFKKGKSLGDESGTEILLNLCTPTQSRAVKSLQVLGAAVVALVDRAGNAEFWYLAISQLGPAKTWSQSTTKRARGIILCAAAGLWRRLVKRFEGWPWRLAAIAN